MKHVSALITLLVLISSLFLASLAKGRGELELDAVSFPKVVDGSKYVLVAWLKYGVSPSSFKSVCQQFEDNSDILIASISDTDFAEKHGITEFPTVQLFIKGSDTAHETFDGSAEDTEALIAFVLSNTESQLRELKRLAEQFSSSDDKSSIKEQAVSIVSNLQESVKKYGEIYISHMNKIIEKGSEFVAREKTRLGDLIKSTYITDEKKKELQQRLQAIKSFVGIQQ